MVKVVRVVVRGEPYPERLASQEPQCGGMSGGTMESTLTSLDAAGSPTDAVVTDAYCVSAAPVALEMPAAGTPKSSSI